VLYEAKWKVLAVELKKWMKKGRVLGIERPFIGVPDG
jgi:hypothetical protein